MSEEIFENNCINEIISAYYFVKSIRKRKSFQFKNIFSINLCLYLNNKQDEILAYPIYFLNLMALSVTGAIKFDEKVIDFNKFIKYEDNNELIIIFYLCITYLIINVFSELKNLYKSTKIVYENSAYILEYIKKIINEGICMNKSYFVNKKVIKYLDSKVPEIIDIICVSNKLVFK